MRKVGCTATKRLEIGNLDLESKQTVTPKRVCAFVLAYAKPLFSHEVAYILFCCILKIIKKNPDEDKFLNLFHAFLLARSRVTMHTIKIKCFTSNDQDLIQSLKTNICS